MLVDDVLYTGRTIRAAINELFDYGRPARDSAGVAGRPRRTRTADRRPFRRRNISSSHKESASNSRDDAQGRLALMLTRE